MSLFSHPVSLGIDLGTSGVKVILLAIDGTLIDTASRALSVSHPQPGWAEQDPADWWQACVAALHELQQKQPHAYAQIGYLGLSGQMHGSVLLDRQNRPLSPAILWNDARSIHEAAWLTERFAGMHEVLGSAAMAGLMAPKLLWLRRHAPHIFAAIDCVMLPKDYLRLKLTGQRMSEMSDAAGTLCLDVRQRNWCTPMIEALGMTPQQFPPLAEGCAPAAGLTPEVAAELKLNPALKIACGAGDNPASAVGIGALEAGDALITLGTSAAVVSVTDAPLTRIAGGIHGFCHALPQRWYAMGAILSGASSLRWVSQLLGCTESVLLNQVSEVFPLERPVPGSAPFFLPYLTGERTPHDDPLMRGGFMNLGIEANAACLGHAVLEGVGFALRDALTSIEAAGVALGTCALVGGGAQSVYWAQLLADLLGRELHTLRGSETSAAIGAAKLGFAAGGVPVSEWNTALPVQAVFTPSRERSESFSMRYEKFRGLLPAAQGLRC